MTYLLDTNVLSDIIRHNPEVKARYELFTSRGLCVSTVTIKEIQFGFRHNPERGAQDKGADGHPAVINEDTGVRCR